MPLKLPVNRERIYTSSSVNKETECWEWSAHRNSGGYGTINAGGKVQLAHRLSYRLFKRPIPEGMCVCHRCDNPCCVNPDHLWLATNAENVRDRDEKGRLDCRVGENNGNAKITEVVAFDIVELLSEGQGPAEIARKLGVGPGIVYSIKYNRTWKHIDRSR